MYRAPTRAVYWGGGEGCGDGRSCRDGVSGRGCRAGREARVAAGGAICGVPLRLRECSGWRIGGDRCHCGRRGRVQLREG